MSNPYKDPNVQLPYQISQNTYKKHFYTDRDGPTPRNTKHFFTDRVEPYTGQPGPYPAAGGRPDMGFYKQDPYAVPYPQEPDRRRRADNSYMRPPEIGFDPYKEQMSKPPQLGWFLLLRYHKSGDDQVRHALTMSNKHIIDDKGEVLGIARYDRLRIREGGMSWLTYGKMRNVGGRWDIQTNPTHELVPYNILVIRFPRLDKAVEWFNRDHFFKQKDFPNPHTLDCMALPEHESFYGKTGGYDTIILSEYPRITHADYFRDEFAIPTEKLMKEKYRGCPYIVRSSVLAYDNFRPNDRHATPLRGSWMRQNSIVTLSFMPSGEAADDYFRDPEYLHYQQSQNRVSDPTTVSFTMENWKF